MQFCPKEFQRFLDNNSYETREKWKQFTKDPIFIPRHNLSLKAQKDLALERLKIVSQNKVFSVYDFSKNPLNVFANHEMASWVDGSLATKLTVQYNLFGGTLFTLGTQRHLKIAEGVDTLDTIGCFALTELGYGNNAVQMETTSTWDAQNKQFIINSPSQLSQKYWITNGALHCNYAIVFAQLIFNEQNEGVHTFLVKIRNEDGSVCKGVEIEDMGAKFGLNGVDNGRLRFTQVRINQDAILNKYSDIDKDGRFSSSIKKKRDRFLKVADRLLSGRLCIASMSIGSTKFGLTTALRYANKRLAVGKKGLSDNPIINFNLFQNQVYPLLAKTIGLNIAFNQIKILYSNSLLNNQDASPLLVCLCCVIKPLITWNARDVATCLIERVGGQGYLSVNRLAELMPSAHSGITAEGDNSVLMQKVSKELLGLVYKDQYEFSKNLFSKEDIFKMKKIDDLNILIDLIRIKENEYIQYVINLTQNQMQDGKDIYEIWMEKENDSIQELAKSFGDRIVADFAFQMIQNSREDIKKPLILYLKLSLLNNIYNNLGWYMVNQIINAEGAQSIETKENQQYIKYIRLLCILLIALEFLSIYQMHLQLKIMKHLIRNLMWEKFIDLNYEREEKNKIFIIQFILFILILKVYYLYYLSYFLKNKQINKYILLQIYIYTFFIYFKQIVKQFLLILFFLFMQNFYIIILQKKNIKVSHIISYQKNKKGLL
ncbi:hypothetical protein IMG5_076320 [Ichthyophthirius multifiliis]|uniref:Acyl-coenzyme A oxidase n=1 Tax=Ichthyophthirius multifiliis TaxID=5932 RepID=G0QQA1_ICHMU|nr:hypothetical protein IMG5_076320 [Ichthyophthirius multifiliis]EGR32602.1 hypothetical protein IMG5_076320 [Ichthyophthirius multifiliis]|eukprot:XP_004036588.1 hypothetical protein IMG5_076320 [Ichthyophthirius multifiliis]